MPLEQILSKIDIYYIEIAREPLEIIVMTDVVVDGRFDKRQLTTDIKSHFTFLRHKGILHFGKFLMDLTENLIFTNKIHSRVRQLGTLMPDILLKLFGF